MVFGWCSPVEQHAMFVWKNARTNCSSTRTCCCAYLQCSSAPSFAMQKETQSSSEAIAQQVKAFWTEPLQKNELSFEACCIQPTTLDVQLTDWSTCFSPLSSCGSLVPVVLLPARWYSVLSVTNCLMQLKLNRCTYGGYSNSAYISLWLEMATGLSGWETDVLWITHGLPKELKPSWRAGCRSWSAALAVQ